MADEIHTLIDAIQTVSGHAVALIVHTGGTWTARTAVAGSIRHTADGATAVEALTDLAIALEQEALRQIESADAAKTRAAATLERLTPVLGERS